ncbi:MAG: DNA-binding protein [Syntrophobacteraceae bacterium]
MGQYINTRGAAEYFKKLGLPFRPSTLEVWRCRGKGPQYKKIGGMVFYEEGALLAFAVGVPYETADSISVHE